MIHINGNPALEDRRELPKVTLELRGRARELCFSVLVHVMGENNTSLLFRSFRNFLPSGRQSLMYELSHPNEWHDLPRHPWAFGCVDVPGIPYAISN